MILNGVGEGNIGVVFPDPSNIYFPVETSFEKGLITQCMYHNYYEI